MGGEGEENNLLLPLLCYHNNIFCIFCFLILLNFSFFHFCGDFLIFFIFIIFLIFVIFPIVFFDFRTMFIHFEMFKILDFFFTSSAGPSSAGPPKISRFFSLSRSHFRSLFLWGSSRGILVVFEAQGPSNEHVWSSRPVGRNPCGPKGRRGFTRQPTKNSTRGPPRDPTLLGPPSSPPGILGLGVAFLISSYFSFVLFCAFLIVSISRLFF